MHDHGARSSAPPSAEQIRRREFATVRRGYDPDQVRDYLAQVAEQVETLEQELREADAAEPARPRPRPMPRTARPEDAAGADAVRGAGEALRHAARDGRPRGRAILDDAREPKRQDLDEARSEADRIRVDAQARAEEARQQGNERSSGRSRRPTGSCRALRAPRDRSSSSCTTCRRAAVGRPRAGDRDRERATSPRRDRADERSAARRAESRRSRRDDPRRGRRCRSGLASRPLRPRRDDDRGRCLGTRTSEDRADGDRLDMPDLAASTLDFDDDTRRD